MCGAPGDPRLSVTGPRRLDRYFFLGGGSLVPLPQVSEWVRVPWDMGELLAIAVILSIKKYNTSTIAPGVNGVSKRQWDFSLRTVIHSAKIVAQNWLLGIGLTL